MTRSHRRKRGAVLTGVFMVAGLAAGAIWARRELVLATVEGSSMEPALRAGDRVLVHRRPLAAVRRGDLVVVRPPPERLRRLGPQRAWNVKRVVALPGDPVPPAVALIEGVRKVPPNAMVVYGDNPTSADSRQRGFFSGDGLLGVVVRSLQLRTCRQERDEA